MSFASPLLAACLVALLSLWFAPAPQPSKRPVPVSAPIPPPLSWLRADGTKIVNEKRETVLLRGVNLGGWLVEEMWMMPFDTSRPPQSTLPQVKDHVTLWQVMEKRFGPAEARKIRTALRDAWVSDADFGRIRAAGLNCVRLPFTFDLLEEPDGYEWIDRALASARRHGLYVILDLHGAPGRQSDSDHTGESGVNRLFKDPAQIKRTQAVWASLARRYKDRPEVAGYDLLNEPMGAPDAVTLHLVQDRLYRTIRAIDQRHLIIIEDGYKGRDTFPHLSVVGWENVALSWHHYNFTAKTEQEQAAGLAAVSPGARTVQTTRPAPVFIGEFQIEPHGTPAALETGIKALQQGGHSWTIWSYKAILQDGGGMWGWYRAPRGLQTLDPYRDSAADLLRKTASLRTENLQENPAMSAVFRASAGWKPLPPPREIVPTARAAGRPWRYTTRTPTEGWQMPAFEDTRWEIGEAGFGAGADIPTPKRTVWQTPDIWLRREFTLGEREAASAASQAVLLACHDDEAEVYLNGVLAATLSGYSHDYREVALTREGAATIRPGRNVIAVHCRSTIGGQFIDIGIAAPPAPPGAVK
ncbi:MAG: cellulase family glycosylhydrolase [Cytophagales bacterium]|nr:cellulase family glycosylhydrolase [Armatimonadota bacterium]